MAPAEQSTDGMHGESKGRDTDDSMGGEMTGAQIHCLYWTCIIALKSVFGAMDLVRASTNGS